MHVNKKDSLWGKAVVALATNVLILAVIQLFTTSYFAIYDDVVMSDISAGYYGDSYSQYLIFPNIIYGLIAKFLGGLFHWINLYGLLQIGIVFFCFWMISYVFMARYSYRIGMVVTLANVVLFGYYGYISVQFTCTAAICCATGTVIFFLGIMDRWVHFVAIGVFQLILGYWIRSDVFLSMLPFIVVLLVVYGIEKRQKEKASFLSRHGLVCFSIVSLMAVVILSGIANHKAYEKSEWTKYTKYNAYRAAILDYEIPPYQQNEAFYQKIGFSENDIAVFANWTYGDPEKFTLKNLKKIETYSSARKQLHVDLSIIKETICKIGESGKGFYCVYVAILLSILAFVMLPGWRKAYVIAMWGVIGAEYWYLLCRGRVPQRSYFAIWMVVFYIFLTLLRDNMPDDFKAHKRWIIGMVICSLLCGAVSLPMLYEQQNAKVYLAEQRKCKRMLKKIAKSPDNLYLGDCRSFDLPRETLYTQNISAKNFVTLGGWICPTPMYQHVLEEYQVTNPMRALAEGKKNVYYITQDNNGAIEMVTTYLKENYNDTIACKKIESKYGYDIYRFYKTKDA